MPTRDEERVRPRQDVGLEVLVSTTLPQGMSAEGYARRLRLLEAARGAPLTDGEFTELRQSVLDEILVRGRLWSPVARLLSVLLVVSGVVTIVGLWLDIEAAYFGAGFLFLVLLVTLASTLLKNYRASRLSLSDRLTIVEHLRSQGLLPESEAHEARRSILAQFADARTA